MKISSLASALLCGGMIAHSVAAQGVAPAARVPKSQGVLVGTLVDSASGRSVHPGRVDLVDARLFAFTDSLGRFVLPQVPVGRHLVLARGIGYVPAQKAFEVVKDTVRLPPIRLRRDHRFDSLNIVAP